MKSKNMLAVIALIALLAWGVLDAGHAPGNPDLPQKGEQAQGQKGTEVGVQKGNLAPDFELQTLAGETMRLSDFKGKKVILNLWATWCPPCRAEMPDMQKFYAENKEKDVVILGVNLTSSEPNQESVSAFLAEYGITFPVVLDVDKSVSKQYQAISVPTSYIIDSRGVIQQKWIGPMDYEMMGKMISAID